MTIKTICAFALALPLTVSVAMAKPTRVDGFPAAQKKSKELNQPLVVFVHGSEWHPASKVYREKLWKSAELEGLLKGVVLTEVEVKQNLTKEQADAIAKLNQGWKAEGIRSYPALQIYAPDGLLLEVYQGKAIRIQSRASILASHLNQLADLSAKRTKLLASIKSARDAGDKAMELALLTQLVELPIRNEPKIVEAFKKVDPEDETGWQAKLSFNHWRFVRHITGLVNAKKHDEAFQQIDALLKNKSRLGKSELALVYGAKGRALLSQAKHKEAWEEFKKAYKSDPHGANGKAMYEYGCRNAGVILREAVPTNSALFGKTIGENISRDFASFKASSASSDDLKDHASLFKGAYARKGYAFHTGDEKGAHIVIDLKAECSVNALRIVNRNNIHERAKGLTLWSSNDAENWQKIWVADAVKPEWGVLLEAPVKARYLKLGLDAETNSFHLRAVDVFGKRGK